MRELWFLSLVCPEPFCDILSGVPMIKYVECCQENAVHPVPEPQSITLGSHVHKFLDIPLFKTGNLLTKLLGKVLLDLSP